MQSKCSRKEGICLPAGSLALLSGPASEAPINPEAGCPGEDVPGTSADPVGVVEAVGVPTRAYFYITNLQQKVGAQEALGVGGQP